MIILFEKKTFVLLFVCLFLLLLICLFLWTDLCLTKPALLKHIDFFFVFSW